MRTHASDDGPIPPPRSLRSAEPEEHARISKRTDATRLGKFDEKITNGLRLAWGAASIKSAVLHPPPRADANSEQSGVSC